MRIFTFIDIASVGMLLARKNGDYEVPLNKLCNYGNSVCDLINKGDPSYTSTKVSSESALKLFLKSDSKFICKTNDGTTLISVRAGKEKCLPTVLEKFSIFELSCLLDKNLCDNTFNKNKNLEDEMI